MVKVVTGNKSAGKALAAETPKVHASMLVASIAAPVRQQVVEMLRAALISGRFVPGQRLVEKDLCELLGVSRPPVREALRELEAEGLIENLPNRGPIVATLSVTDARNIYYVRGVLEALAAKLFTLNASAEQRKELDAVMTKVEHSYSKGDVEDRLKAKMALYSVLLSGSNNKIITNTLRSMNTRIVMLRRLSLSSPERLPESLKEIRLIIAAIRDRDPEAAFAAALAHVDKASEVALAAMK